LGPTVVFYSGTHRSSFPKELLRRRQLWGKYRDKYNLNRKHLQQGSSTPLISGVGLNDPTRTNEARGLPFSTSFSETDTKASLLGPFWKSSKYITQPW